MPVATNAIEQEIRIEASPETVFAYLVEGDKMPLWMGSEANLDPRPGGLFWMRVNDNWTARGEFVEVDSPRRVVFTWGWESESAAVAPGSTTVEITLTAQEGGTLVRLEHRDLPEAERAMHSHGWDHYLERLVVAAAGGDAGPDPWAEEGAGRS